MRTIDWVDGAVEIIDQTALPDTQWTAGAAFPATFTQAEAGTLPALPAGANGSTVKPKGFRELFARTLRGRSFPIEVAEVRTATDPLTATARGAHIAAMFEK